MYYDTALFFEVSKCKAKKWEKLRNFHKFFVVNHFL